MVREFTHSEFSTFQDCPKQWWFKYNQLLETPRVNTKLFLGSMIHEAVALFYTQNRDMSVFYLAKECEKFEGEEEEKYNFKTLAFSMFNTFADFAEKNDDFKVIEIEKMRSVSIPGRKNCKYTFTPDGIVERNGKIWIRELKTAKTIDTGYLNSLVLDEQMSRYCWAYERATGNKVYGVVYDIVKKSIPKKPEVLKSGTLTKRTDIDTTYEVYVEAIRNNALQEKDYEDILGILKMKGNTFIKREFVMRNDKEKKEAGERISVLASILKQKEVPIYKCPSDKCNWKCDFRNLCIEDTEELRSVYSKREVLHTENLAKEAVNE